MRSNKIAIGILAHVDAGKTTLSESILYVSGSIRKLGRVDHGNTFFDTNDLERARGITIFSKQAQFYLGDKEVYLLDTPGHVDFSAEMERTLQVLDYAILVINGADGIQNHTLTLWRLLKLYQIPVFLFINKMDQAGTDQNKLIWELQNRLDDRCIDFSGQNATEFLENIAMCEETLMEEYLLNGNIAQNEISRAIANRIIFPCFFGSALKSHGIHAFLDGLRLYCEASDYPEELAAMVYKITRDDQGNRLTHMKITGGCLRVKALLMDQKVNQIRIYSGTQFVAVNEAEAGTICAVMGLSHTRSGQGLGAQPSAAAPVLKPVLSYRIQLPKSCDSYTMLLNLRQLEEEEPELHIIWDARLSEIHVQVMGEIEIEILKNIILERFNVEVFFEPEGMIYKETIKEPVEGVGHFEPLKHYAEVHLLMEPGEQGSGLRFANICDDSILERNWQRLIMTHLSEKKHIGVLTGSEITDMKITLVAGKSHQKHTEGGDFRQAAYRAVRQGLKKAKSVLLEPVYEFCLEIPVEAIGRALSDVQKMGGRFDPPLTIADKTVINGYAPVVAMRDYQNEVSAYTKGSGKLFTILKGYEPCQNAEEIILKQGYDSEKDPENPTGSVFCANGAGYVVGWEEVEGHMHVDSGLRFEQAKEETEKRNIKNSALKKDLEGYGFEKELEEIFVRTYGPAKRDLDRLQKRPLPIKKEEAVSGHTIVRIKNKERYLLVDGYNIIFSWDDLKELAAVSLDAARNKLIDILCNYQGFTKLTLILVFDAYKVEGGLGAVIKQNNIFVIYTKEAETADQYIEKAVNKMGSKHDVTVATSDHMVQMIIWGDGARRLSAQDLKEEIEAANREIRSSYLARRKVTMNLPFQNIAETNSKE